MNVKLSSSLQTLRQKWKLRSQKSFLKGYAKCFMRNPKCAMQNVLWGYAKWFLMFLFLYLKLPIYTECVFFTPVLLIVVVLFILSLMGTYDHKKNIYLPNRFYISFAHDNCWSFDKTLNIIKNIIFALVYKYMIFPLFWLILIGLFFV